MHHKEKLSLRIIFDAQRLIAIYILLYPQSPFPRSPACLSFGHEVGFLTPKEARGAQQEAHEGTHKHAHQG